MGKSGWFSCHAILRAAMHNWVGAMMAQARSCAIIALWLKKTIELLEYRKNQVKTWHWRAVLIHGLLSGSIGMISLSTVLWCHAKPLWPLPLSHCVTGSSATSATTSWTGMSTAPPADTSGSTAGLSRWVLSLGICLSLSVYVSVCMSLCLSLYVCLYESLCVSMSLQVSISLCVCPCVSVLMCLSVCLCWSLSVCVSTCMYLCLSLSLCMSRWMSMSLCLCLFVSVCLCLPVNSGFLVFSVKLISTVVGALCELSKWEIGEWGGM